MVDDRQPSSGSERCPPSVAAADVVVAVAGVGPRQEHCGSMDGGAVKMSGGTTTITGKGAQLHLIKITIIYFEFIIISCIIMRSNHCSHFARFIPFTRPRSQPFIANPLVYSPLTDDGDIHLTELTRPLVHIDCSISTDSLISVDIIFPHTGSLSMFDTIL